MLANAAQYIICLLCRGDYSAGLYLTCHKDTQVTITWKPALSHLAMLRLYSSMGLFHSEDITLQILSNFRRFGCKYIMAGCENIAKIKVIYIHGSPPTHTARHLTSEDHQAAKEALVNTCCLFPISFFM